MSIYFSDRFRARKDKRSPCYHGTYSDIGKITEIKSIIIKIIKIYFINATKDNHMLFREYIIWRPSRTWGDTNGYSGKS